MKGKNKVARLYFFSSCAALIWGINAFIATTTSDLKLASLCLKIAYCGVLFIPVFVEHSVLSLLNQKSRFFLAFCYLQAFYFLYLTLSSTLFKIDLIFDSFYYFRGTPLALASFVCWIVIVIVAHTRVLTHLKRSVTDKRKFTFFFFGLLVGFGGGVTNFLPVFYIDIYPYGNFVIPISYMITAYAILKHQLLEIEVVIKKSIVYSIILTIISIFYLMVVFIFERFVQGYFGYKSFIFSIFIAFLLGLLLIPLRNRIQHWVDKLFFQRSTAEIAEENRRLMHEVEKVDQLKSVATLASGVAHEIKNPLTAINTFAEQLPQRLNDKEFLKNFSRIVGGEVTRINDLVHNLLDYAKPSPPKRVPANIAHLIDETIELLSSAFVKYNIVIKRDYGKIRKVPVHVDAKQIRQALINILKNALEAMSTGGTLSISAKLSATSARGGEGCLLIAIKDTGPGIPEKTLQNLFIPFFTTKDGGTGLGLSVTRGIIEQHGGSLTAHNHPNGGAEFVIELPLESHLKTPFPSQNS